MDSSEYELQMDLQMDKVPELALPELTAESTTKNERLEPWTELLLQVNSKTMLFLVNFVFRQLTRCALDDMRM